MGTISLNLCNKKPIGLNHYIYRKENHMAQNHRSTQRALDILDLLAFCENPNGYTLTELATQLAVPKSSISPIIHTLESNHYLEFDSLTARYCIGRRAFEVGSAYVRNDVFYSRALSIMRNIVNRCSETCHIGELQGSEVVYLMKIESPQPIRMISAVGKRLPANCVALGKALLCEYTLDEIKALFKDGLPRMTKSSITDVNELYRQIVQIRETHIAREKEENYQYIQCLATPIYKNGKPVLALSVSVPTFRYTEEKGAQIEQLLMEAKDSLELII